MSGAPDHRTVVSAIAPATRAALVARSDGPALLRAGLHLGAIGAIGVMIAAQVPFWALLMLPQGILIAFLFTALHEATHETAFATGWMNRALAIICGAALLIVPHYFRAYHFAHHRHTQDPAKDPELESPKPDSLPRYAWHLSGLPTWAAALGVLVRATGGREHAAFIPARQRARIRAEARALLLLYGALLALSLGAQTPVLLYVWIIPAVLGQPFLRAFLLAEHGRCALVANMLENTRTTLTNRALRWLSWNMSFHAEHHSLPTVPFHKLPALHAKMHAHLRVTSPGYRAFHADYRGALTPPPGGTSVGSKAADSSRTR